jgi:molecular chaperone GrpE
MNTMEDKEPMEAQSAAADAAPESAAAADPIDAPLTPAQLAELKEKAARCAQFQDQWMRSVADFDNFKKRSAREKQEAIKFANEGLLEKFIPILDNFEMALSAAGAANTSIESLKAGVQMIAQQLKGAMSDAGLQEIEATGRPFDPNLHEAISQQESAEVPEGHVVQQVRRGYRLRERLLRPASVIVAKKPAA